MIKRAIFILLYLTSDVILETCRDKNRSTFTIAQANRQECMVKKTMKTWRNANKELKKYVVAQMRNNRLNMKKDRQFCEKISEKYLPFGLENRVPSNLLEFCNDLSDIQETCESKSTESSTQNNCNSTTRNDINLPTEIDSKRVPNIIMLGPTGAGKSFFGNGLFGEKTPETGKFGTSKGSTSCTHGVTGLHGLYYGDQFKSYGIETLPINVFDTPGFFDSDPCWHDENKKAIASKIGVNAIDVFAFFMEINNVRIDSSIQEIFIRLHEWTNGNIWNNIVFVFGRTERSKDKQSETFKEMTSITKELDTRLEELKKLLFKLAREKQWKILVNEKTLQTRAMISSDFNKMKYITLNVNQNRYCHVGEDGFIDAEANNLCWPMPSFDDYGDYEIDMETGEQKYRDNEWVLVEDVRIFRSIIDEFMKHPVKTETGRLMQELEKDKNEYYQRHNITEKEQNKIDKMYEVNDKIDVDICKQQYANATKDASLNDENCPYWGPWRSIGKFGGPENKCSKKCGLGKRHKLRDCYIEREKLDEPNLCIDEFVSDRAYDVYEECSIQPYCDFTEWTQWSECSALCGSGTRKRSRTCQGDICNGASDAVEPCYLKECLSEWAAWSKAECEGHQTDAAGKQCGWGKKTSERECPGPHRCLGKYMKIQKCYSTDCLKWGDTSRSCSNCRTKISRQCLKQDRNNKLTPASGCQGWSTQDGGICCEQEKDDGSILGTILKIGGGVLGGTLLGAG